MSTAVVDVPILAGDFNYERTRQLRGLDKMRLCGPPLRTPQELGRSSELCPADHVAAIWMATANILIVVCGR